MELLLSHKENFSLKSYIFNEYLITLLRIVIDDINDSYKRTKKLFFDIDYDKNEYLHLDK